jgi:hypothetical protein
MHFSMSVDELVTKFWSPALLTLAVTAIWKRKVKSRIEHRIFLAIALTGLILALGPALKWMGQSVKTPNHIPLPYAGLYYLVPGFKAFRTPSRWVVLLGLGMSVWGGMAMAATTRPQRILLSGILVWLTLIYLPKLPISEVVSRSEYPPIYYWLKDKPGEVLLELPIITWGQGESSRREVMRMLFATMHDKRLVNGYSGFTPPVWEKCLGEWNSLDGNEILSEPCRLKVDYVVFDGTIYDTKDIVELQNVCRRFEQAQCIVAQANSYQFIN